METKVGLQVRVFLSGLIFALLLNPLAYGLPQEPASPPPQDRPAQNTQEPQSQDPQSQNKSAQGAPVQPSATQPDPGQPSDNELPDSPGAVRAQSVQSSPPPEPTPQTQPQAQAQDEPQGLPRDRSHQPVGTAAAESIPTSGSAASRPAGAALAPAKQRRVRSVVIKVGALVGVGAAVGATMALSHGSPSKPPGSH